MRPKPGLPPPISAELQRVLAAACKVVPGGETVSPEAMLAAVFREESAARVMLGGLGVQETVRALSPPVHRSRRDVTLSLRMQQVEDKIADSRMERDKKESERNNKARAARPRLQSR